jgi:hypothetical protein
MRHLSIVVTNYSSIVLEINKKWWSKSAFRMIARIPQSDGVTKKGVANKVMAFRIKLVSPYEPAAIVLHKPCVTNGVEVDE